VPAKAAPPVPAKATPAPATVEEPTPAPPRAAAPEQGALPAAAGPGKAKAAPASPHPVQVVPAAAAKVAPQPPPAAGPGPRPARPYRGWALGMGAALLLGSLGALWRRRRRPQLGPWGAPLDPRQQTRYGPYGINGILGVGGCATAYRGQHLGTGAAVAVKVPHPHLVRDPEFRARFQREADLGARLEHPRIVPILASGVEEEEPWLAMPFIEGLTLDLRLGRGGPLPLAEALAIATGIAEAIAYAHTRSVVHRDLKPANLILTPKGVMVMDFGIARVLDASQTTSTLFLGTPAYAAPECVTTPQVGPPADRYALGIILFEMLTGHPPFTGQSPFQILEAHCSQPLPPCPQAPPAVLQLLQRLCAKAPEARPEDGEVLAILERLRANDTSSRS